MLSEKILEILEKQSEIDMDDLKRELKVHYGVLYKIIKELMRENKVVVEKRKQPHKKKKYRLIIKYTI